MLMNHKNFHFTQIPDKTNDMIFLKSLKTLFLDHFFQKLWLSQTTIYGPLTPCNSEKTYGQTERWMEGWTEGQTNTIL